MPKKCPSCNETKPADAFAKNTSKGDGLQYRCKACWAQYRKDNRDKMLAQKREHYEKNKERLLADKRTGYLLVAETKKAYQRDYAAKNKEQVLAKNRLFHINNPDYYKDFRKNNPAKINAKEIRRKAAKLSRTPKWLTADDHWMIEQAYELAALRTKIFGFAWHVDHILPLQGKLVSGFHTPYNLQVIPARDNLLKSNIYKV
jgi:5-methylcytosine-specific restriction endonuclease McrA